MSRLHAEPMSTVRTVPDLHALASGMASQAVALYSDLGARMAEFGNENAREAFKRVEALQRGHAGEIDPAPSDLPEVFRDEGLRDLRLVTPYRAFALAVRNEERAFAFWSYMSAHATNPAVKEEAERLALEEMDHVKALRSERRRAYQSSSDPALERLRIASLPELRAEAARREADLADLHGRIAEALRAAGDEHAERIAAIAREEHESAKALGGAEDAQAEPVALPDDPQELRSLAIAQLEIAVEVYLYAAEWSGREDVVSEAQALADQSLRRLARLR
ncbi:hypothetical protein [Palleronia sp.]|uniref:hypothetical protein n=1 Tax=Palleronia sp. TaxID=1940284 RepID=UPI0035C7A6EC